MVKALVAPQSYGNLSFFVKDLALNSMGHRDLALSGYRLNQDLTVFKVCILILELTARFSWTCGAAIKYCPASHSDRH